MYVMCAGLASGSQPPHRDPPHLPSHCESVPLAATGKGRGPATGGGYVRHVQACGRIEVRFDLVNDTYKAVGAYSSWFISAIGICVRDFCDPGCESWAQVPESQKQQVSGRIQTWFIVDYTARSGIFLRVVYREAASRFSDWKCRLRCHYDDHGGDADLASALLNPHPSIREATQWEKCCRRFASERFKKKSKTQKQNRAKVPYQSLQGRKSLQAHLVEKEEKTSQPQSLIRAFETFHRRGQDWVNTQAEETYRRLEERATQVAATAASVGCAPPSDRDILRLVLGGRRGHERGVGPTFSSFRVSSSDASTSYAPPPDTVSMQDYQQLLQDHQHLAHEHQHVTARVDTMAGILEQFRSVFAHMHPGVPIPEIPSDIFAAASRATSVSSPSSATAQHDNDVHLGD